MIIGIEPSLPCAQYRDGTSICGEPASMAVIAPFEDHTWEMVPVCAVHLIEAGNQIGSPVSRLDPSEIRALRLNRRAT